MKLVLHDELWRDKPCGKPLGRFRGSVEGTVESPAVFREDPAEEHSRFPAPWQHGELVDRRDEERRELPVDLFVDEEHGEPFAIPRRGERALEVDAADDDFLASPPSPSGCLS